MSTFDDIAQAKFETVTGDFWLPVDNHNDSVIGVIKQNTMFDHHVVEYSKPFISPGDTVIDIGANFGQMTLQWSKLVGETGYVHSFECSEFVSYFLKKTLAINPHAKNVTVHTEAAWHTPGIELSMLIPDGTQRGQYYSGMGIKGDETMDDRAMPTHKVISTTVDSFEYVSPVSLIKVDAQGSDFFALKGAENTIKKHHPMITFEYEPEYDAIFGISYKELDEWLVSLGYKHRNDIFYNGHDYVYTYDAEV